MQSPASLRVLLFVAIFKTKNLEQRASVRHSSLPRADNCGGVGARGVRGLTDATHVVSSFWRARTLSALGTATYFLDTLSHTPIVGPAHDVMLPGRSTSNLPACAVAVATRLTTAFAASAAHCVAWLRVQPPPQSAMASLPLRTSSSQVTALPPFRQVGACFHPGGRVGLDVGIHVSPVAVGLCVGEVGAFVGGGEVGGQSPQV